MKVDVALLGTGVAPLVAARKLIEQGKKVALINPDWDYFAEDSELPLDPLWPFEKEPLSAQRLLRNHPDEVLKILRPSYPGAVESWSFESPGKISPAAHSMESPFIRIRNRLWIRSQRPENDYDLKSWDQIENLFVLAADLGFNPMELQSLSAVKRFPGYSAREIEHSEHYKGISLPRFCDVDVSRFRTGVLEFLQHRLEPTVIFKAASQLEVLPSGLSFYIQGERQSVDVSEGICVFWTPRLHDWITQQKPKNQGPQPQGIRVWEEWLLVSRDRLDPATVGVFEDMIVWARVEGAPQAELEFNELAVLKPGRCFLPGAEAIPWHEMFATSQSFMDLATLCEDFLHWDRYSIRSMRPRATMEWQRQESPYLFKKNGQNLHLLPHSDGSLTEVVYNVQKLMEFFNG